MAMPIEFTRRKTRSESNRTTMRGETRRLDRERSGARWGRFRNHRLLCETILAVEKDADSFAGPHRRTGFVASFAPVYMGGQAVAWPRRIVFGFDVRAWVMTRLRRFEPFIFTSVDCKQNQFAL
jgi:hypothetical protein